MDTIELRNGISASKVVRRKIAGLAAGISPPDLRFDQPNSVEGAEPVRKQSTICGAMAQQNGDSGWGNQYAPQKFLHLVGCRENKAVPEAAKRPGLAKA